MGAVTLYRNAWVVTMDDAATEHPDGWLLVRDGLIEAVGARSRARRPTRRSTFDGAVVTPGLVNTHHHLYQTLTRARAQEATLFEWLVALYPVWAHIDAESEYAAARTGLAELALSGCSTVFDHHYVFPRGRTGLVEAEVRAARELGVRIVASRGSMDLGESQGGLPPDSLVEEIDDVLADTERLAALQDGDGLVQIAVAPCSPFSVTERLMSESAALARRLGLVLHTHLAETRRGGRTARELYGCRPVEYLDQLGWLDGDVWCAHCVHLSDGRHRRASRATGDGRRALPDVEPPPRRGHRAGARAARRRRPGRARRRRLRVERARRPLLRGQAGAAGRARARRPAGADRPRGAPARDARRRRRAAAATTSARSSRGSGPTSPSGATDGLELGGADDPVAGLVLAGPAPRRPPRRRRRGRRPRRQARARRRGRDRARAPCPGT